MQPTKKSLKDMLYEDKGDTVSNVCDKITDAVVAKIIEDGMKLVDTEKIVKSIVPVLERSIMETIKYQLEDGDIFFDVVNNIIDSKMMKDHISNIIESAFNINKPAKKSQTKKK